MAEPSDSIPQGAETMTVEVQVAPGSEEYREASIMSMLQAHPFVKEVDRDV